MLATEENVKPLSNQELAAAYIDEIRGLCAITALPEFSNILQKIQNYGEFLRSRAQMPLAMTTIQDETKRACIIEVAKMPPAVRENFCIAHLAACSILLDGARFPLDRLKSDSFVPQIQQMLANPYVTEPQRAQTIMRRLMGMDAVRVIQLLRTFGLITRKSGEMRQLGLGASTGEKDFHYVHTGPSVTTVPSTGGLMITFASVREQVADIIINDLDPRYEDQYKQLAKDPLSPITGYVCDAFELMNILGKGNIAKRNLVTLLRIEPAMIPDSREFLRRLHPILDESCDLVLSIGLGDSAEAFQKRVDVITSMFGVLDEAGLEPVLFKLHLDGDVAQQALSLQFGGARSASFEILYCRLDSEILKQALA